jgi:hypothetical protein
VFFAMTHSNSILKDKLINGDKKLLHLHVQVKYCVLAQMHLLKQANKAESQRLSGSFREGGNSKR